MFVNFTLCRHGLRMTKFELGVKEPDLRRVRCFVNEEEGGGMDTAPGSTDLMDDVFVEFDMVRRHK
jgi:hypothetical protein